MARREHRTIDTDDHPRIAFPVAQQDLIENTLMKERDQGKTSRDYNLLSIPTIPEAAGAGGTKRGLRVEAIDDARDAEVIPPEEGVCRFCFRMLKGDDNILKTKCGCRLTLMHTECANTHWPSTAATCAVCKQDVQTISVIIRVIIAPYSEFHSHMRKSTPAEINYKNVEDNHNDEQLKVQKPTSTETKKEKAQPPEIKMQKPPPTSIGNAHGRRCCIL